MARVSIGLPVYNGEKYLERTLRSILNQTFSDFELIICDNASTDGTQAICKRYAESDNRIRYVINEENIGAARNYDKTFHLSSSEYFKWAAADDILLPTYFEECVVLLDASPDVVLCTSYVELIDEDDEPLSFDSALGSYVDSAGNPRLNPNNGPKPNHERPHNRLKEVLLTTPPCYDVFSVVRRNVMAQTSLHGLWYGSDRAFLAEMALFGKIGVVPKVLLRYREHGGQSIMLNRKQRKAWIGKNFRSQYLSNGVNLRLQLAERICAMPMPILDKIRCLGVVNSKFDPPAKRSKASGATGGATDNMAPAQSQ